MERIYEFLAPIQNILEYIVVFLYQKVIANYGVVIILLTLIVRLVLTPLTIYTDKVYGKDAENAAADKRTPKKV